MAVAGEEVSRALEQVGTRTRPTSTASWAQQQPQWIIPVGE